MDIMYTYTYTLYVYAHVLYIYIYAYVVQLLISGSWSPGLQHHCQRKPQHPNTWAQQQEEPVYS